MGVSIPYRRYAVGGKTIFRPVLTVEIERHGRILQLDALVDTGADLTLFPAEVAVFLGLHLSGVAAQSVLTAGGHVLRIRFARVDLRLPIDYGIWSWPSRIGFADDIEHAILGQEGFLDHFRVCLDRRRRVLDVIPGNRLVQRR